ncbi:hypothetical protein Y032_0153g2906 [Ancylostoma ceylanicum]|nr:hypothetical protein Y032_0153g2906 [Ancylostoma ceylanicum]
MTLRTSEAKWPKILTLEPVVRTTRLEASARELTEEDFLASPDDEQQMLEHPMETESQRDAMVSDAKETERLIKLVDKYVTRIGIECESVLTRKFRSNDPV